MHLFFFSVFFGLMPYNYLCVTSGVILSEIKTVRDSHIFIADHRLKIIMI